MNLIEYLYLQLINFTKRAWVYDKMFFPCFTISMFIFFNTVTIAMFFAKSKVLGPYIELAMIASWPISFILLWLKFAMNKKYLKLEEKYAKLTNDNKKRLNVIFWIYFVGTILLSFLVPLALNHMQFSNKHLSNELQ